jgi:hypothetical protein
MEQLKISEFFNSHMLIPYMDITLCCYITFSMQYYEYCYLNLYVAYFILKKKKADELRLLSV